MNALPWFLAGLALGSFAAAALLRRRRTVPSTAVPPAPTPAERTASHALVVRLTNTWLICPGLPRRSGTGSSQWRLTSMSCFHWPRVIV
ncbi:MAG: hypothetical protein ACK6D1_18275, partial [Planctomycetota bacterium]